MSCAFQMPARENILKLVFQGWNKELPEGKKEITMTENIEAFINYAEQLGLSKKGKLNCKVMIY